MLSIHTVILSTGHSRRALQRFFARFAAIWPLSNFNLAVEVSRLEILDFDVRGPLTTPEVSSTTAMAAAQQTRLLASTNTCRCTASAFVTFLIMLLGTVTFFNCFVYLVHSFLRGSDLRVPTFLLITRLSVYPLSLHHSRRYYAKGVIYPAQVAESSW